MFETFNRRLDRSKAETMTIRQFLKDVKKTRNGIANNYASVRMRKRGIR